MTSRGRALEAQLSVGLIGDRELAGRAQEALAAAGMEGMRIGAAESRLRLGQGLDVLVVSGGPPRRSGSRLSAASASTLRGWPSS